MEKSEKKYSDKNILIVDDSNLNLKVMKAFLTSITSKIGTANDGKEALEKIKDYHFDLLFVDLQMEEISGLDFIKIVRKEEREQKKSEPLNIVAMSATLSEELIETLLKEGFNSYLQKPIMQETLIDYVIKTFEK